MSEEKIVIPAYVRIGICKECGADVYAPQGIGLPHMSACSCPARGETTTQAEASKLLAARRAESDPQQKPKAA